MTPVDRILTEGDISWRLDRGWRIVPAREALRLAPTRPGDGWWWFRPGEPLMALNDHETEVWENP